MLIVSDLAKNEVLGFFSTINNSLSVIILVTFRKFSTIFFIFVHVALKTATIARAFAGLTMLILVHFYVYHFYKNVFAKCLQILRTK